MLETILGYLPMLWAGTQQTLFVTFASVLFGYVLGLPLGICMIMTAPQGLAPHRTLHGILGWVINIGRSIPFIILMLALIPLARAIVGTSIGPKAAVVSLVVASAPFIARLVESSLAEIDSGVVEAARTMGATRWQIIWKVLLPESVPALLRGASIATITLIGYSAMAGAVGGGGLGQIAISYGYHRYQSDVMILTIILLVILVQVIQGIFNLAARLLDKRSR